MSNNESKKAKLNVMDIIIVLFVLLCIGVFVYRAMTINDLTKEENLDNYKIFFKIEKVKLSTVEALKTSDGKNVFIEGVSEPIGTLAYVDTEKISTEFIDGEIYSYPSYKEDDDTLFDVKGGINVKGIESKGGFLIFGEKLIAPNNTLELSTEDFTATITVLSIEK